MHERGVLLSVAGGGPSGHVADWSRKIIQGARERGLSTVVADLPGNLASVESAPDVRKVAVDWRSPNAVVSLARDLREQGLSAVVGFREFSLVSTAEAAKAVGLAWNETEVVRLTRDKWRCRRRVAKLGFPQPMSVACESVAEAVTAIRRIGMPAVVKPRSAYGSQGVAVVRTARQAASAAEFAARFGQGLLVEELVEGDEFSAEGVIVGGSPTLLAIHRKRVADDDTFVETGHRTADDLAPTVVAELRRTLRLVLTGLGLTRSAFHVEFWTTSVGVVLGEVHARIGGDWIHRLVELSSGVDVFGAVLDDLLSLQPRVADAVAGVVPKVGAAVSVLHGSPGIVRGVTGVADVCRSPWIVALDIAAGTGARLGSERESGDRPGLIVARSPRGTPSGSLGLEAQRVADELSAQVRYEVTKHQTIGGAAQAPR